jgi:hypothetical protein
MIAYYVRSIKKGLRKRFSKGTLTFITFILGISLLNKIAINSINVKNIIL